jgi:hypothetical protein
MHRVVLIFIWVLLFIVPDGRSQGNIEDQFRKLRLNSSPAYVVLGVEPENIQRPNSPTDFLACVQSAVVNDRLQPNFAIETSPYYWSSKKAGLQKFDATYFLVNNNYWENLQKSFTISFATSSADTVLFGNKRAGTGLAGGFHLQLMQGKLSPRVEKNLSAWFYASRIQLLYNSLIQALEGADDATVDDVDSFITDLLEKGSLKSLPEMEKENIRLLFLKRLDRISLTQEDLVYLRRSRGEIERVSQSAITRVNEYQFPLAREGFMVELSFAHAGIAIRNSWDSIHSAKTAIWLTPSYRFNVNEDPTIIDIIDLMAVLRFTFNAKDVDASHYADIGAKLQWLRNRFSFSGEAVLRYLTRKPQGQKKNHTFRTGLTFSYKMSDLVTFQATFGSNFDGNSTRYSDPSKMFMIGGFHFGFSNFLKDDKD